MTPVQGRIFDVVKGSVTTVALFLAFFFLPVIGMIPGMFAAAPGAFYTLKHGRQTGITLVAASSALLAAVAEPAAVLIYLLQAGIMSLALPEFLIRGKGGARSVVYAVAVNLLSIVVAAGLFSLTTGSNLHAKVKEGVQASIVQTGAVYQKMGITGDDLKAMQSSMQQAGELIVTIYPALITVVLGTIAVMNLLVLALVALRLGQPFNLVGDFKKYRNPEPLVWVLIIAGFGMLVPQEVVFHASRNLVIVVSTFYAVQGFAVMSHFFHKYQVPKWVRLIGYLLLIFQPFMVLAVAVLGVFDLWGDFRSPNKQENL
jgi:uncharacterized protein YybS (DUF2232 family)